MSKIELKKSNITLKFITSKDIGKTYKVEYSVHATPSKHVGEDSPKLTMRSVDQSSLKKAIFSNLQKKDEVYMDLVSFDLTKAIFYLKLDKWMKDTTKGLEGVKDIKDFSINFKLKELPPPMIIKDILKTEWNEFIVRKVKQWVSEKKNRESRLLNIIFPKSVVKSLTQNLSNMFDWSYNNRLNKIEAKLKSTWVTALMYATVKLTKEESLVKLKREMRSRLFSIKVKKELDRREKK